MTVHCPHCSTGYLLPDHLVGPRGARVGCPNCRGAFVVLPPDHGPEAVDGVPVSVAPPAEEAVAIANQVLEGLAGSLGESLVDARQRGTVLSQHGPAIMEAFAEYCRRAGAGGPDPFRAALRDRCGVDLLPRSPV